MPPFLRFFQCAFLRHAPRRYALMLSPQEAQRLGQKYDERRGTITTMLLQRHLAGVIALAAPAATGGRAHLLPLDVDAGGVEAIRALIYAARRRGLWAFGQYCPRPSLAEPEQRGYVWLVFEQLEQAERLQLLGEQLTLAVAQDGSKIEARASHAVTRLPLARHMHTGRFGDLVLADQVINIDADPTGARVLLCRHYRENPVSSLPTPPLPAPAPRQKRQEATSNRSGITIDRYNHSNDLVSLLESYGAQPAKGRGSRRLMHCCGHADERRASLLLWKNRSGVLCCKCLSEHHHCPLADEMRDPFGVYCAMEGLTPIKALRRLNGRDE